MQPTPKGQTQYSDIYHWRCVAKWREITWEYFSELDTTAQAGYVAEYETAMRLAALDAEHQRKEMQRQQRRARSAAQMRSAHRRRR